MNTVPRYLLAAMLPFAAKRDVRPYLTGVLIEATKHGLAVVGCDGTALGAVTITDHPWTLGPCIVPRDVVATLVKAKSDNVVFTEGFRATAGHTSLSFDACPGTFPDWRRIVAPPLRRGELPFALGEAVLAPALASIKALAQGRRYVGLTVTHTQQRVHLLPSWELPPGVRAAYVLSPLRDTHRDPIPLTYDLDPPCD